MLIFSPLRHLLNNLGKLFLEVCVPNRKIRRILKGEMAKFYLKKYVKRAIKYSKSEEIVQKAIDNLMQDKTVFVIAHRLSTIRNADKIVVINQGEIAEQGTHEELLQIENGAYKTLYDMQFKKQEEANA